MNPIKRIQRKSNGVKVLSLFSGAGGLDLGFSSAGFDVVISSDFEERFLRSIELNKGRYFGDDHVSLPVDVTDLNVSDLPFNGFDFLIGGPPCQSFSAAGRRAGGVSGVNDIRGSLFWHYCRLIDEIKPRGFLFENVRGLLQANKGKDWEIIHTSFKELGYSIHYRVLDAAAYGVPQHRERVIVVGVRDGEFLFPRPTHGPDSVNGTDYVGVGEALRGLPKEESNIKPIGGKYGHLLDEIPPGLNYLHFTEEMGHSKPQFAWRSRFSDFLYKVDPKYPSKTIVASPSKFSGPFHWDNRRFSVSELKRIQSFPDDYELSGPEAMKVKQIGNSVAPIFAHRLAESVASQVFSIEECSTELISQSFKLSHDYRKALKARRTRATSSKHRKREPSLFDQSLSNDELGAYPTMRRSRTWCYISPRVVAREAVVGKVFGVFKVECRLSRCKWSVQVRRMNNSASAPKIKLHIPFDRVVGNSFKEIECDLYSDSAWDVPVAWDAINLCISESSSFSDIHPLYGHFTEPYPKFRVSISTSGRKSGILKLIDKLCDFEFLSHTHPLETLPQLIGSKADPKEIAKKIRSFGFDMRLHETNRTIPKGTYRICYPFTLPNDMPSFVNWVELGEHGTADKSSIPAVHS